MNVVSVNVGQPRAVQWKGRTIETGIFKAPVASPVAVLADRLVGDEQVDRRVHGGPDKAVYAYDLDHYAFWEAQLPTTALTPGIFGENLTTSGLPDHAVCLGDTFAVGTAVLVALQPRLPCVKLGLRFNDEHFVKQFQAARRSGIYFGVRQPGQLQAGDALMLVERTAPGLTIQAITDQFYRPDKQADQLAALLAQPLLPAFFRESFQRMLQAC
ncbi:MOSC domain-containing protein [Hymenobacter cellulosivorans]|uniref:MOSC domain-containing protein n=1 Tax=Hymenobacter cellulosivorans TaxID=2932249 RepID=A0ABY4FGP5_9BACT|nr:MOSC domain-containing protein [Hymenobacter cellulosivorans]UOQ55139.1 MOSC domain-containing protein [Hymenobacter cellulosivorans]